MIQQQEDKENLATHRLTHKFDSNKTEWHMRLGKVDIDDAAITIKKFQYAKCQVLYADCNSRVSILADISGPQYLGLKVMDVGNNGIESIEGLRNVNMPNLEKLWLNKNNLTSIKPLSRCHIPSLKTLWLSENLFVEIDAECHFKDIKQLYLRKKSGLGSVANIMKYELPSLTWTALSSMPGGAEDETIVNVVRWEGRLRWKFRNLERVWMPLYFSHIQQRDNNINNLNPRN